MDYRQLAVTIFQEWHGDHLNTVVCDLPAHLTPPGSIPASEHQRKRHMTLIHSHRSMASPCRIRCAGPGVRNHWVVFIFCETLLFQRIQHLKTASLISLVFLLFPAHSSIVTVQVLLRPCGARGPLATAHRPNATIPGGASRRQTTPPEQLQNIQHCHISPYNHRKVYAHCRSKLPHATH